MSLNNYSFEPSVDPYLIPTLIYYQTVWDTHQREVYHNLSTNPHYFSLLRRSRHPLLHSTQPSETSTYDDMSDTTTIIVDPHHECSHSHNNNQEISSSPPAADTTPQFAINADQYQLLQEEFQHLVQVSEVEVMLATHTDHKEKIKQRSMGEDILEHEKEMTEIWENYVYAQQQHEESALLNSQEAKRNGGLGRQHHYHHHGYGGGGRHASGDSGSLHYEADVDMPDL